MTLTFTHLLLAILAALGLGGAIGWFAGSRRAEAAEAGAAGARGQLAKALLDLDTAMGRAGTAEVALAAARAGEAGAVRERDRLETDGASLRAALGEAQGARQAAEVALERLRSEQAERDRAHAAQIETLRAAEERLVERFHAVGAKVLEGAQDQFLRRADDRFRQTEEAQAKSVAGLLAPVAEKLSAYEAAVARIEKERTEAYGNLTGLMDAMRAGQEDVRREAQALVNSLRNAPKARGRWGEQQLCNVLEASGLTKGIDFEMEVSRTTEEGRLRPDAVIRTPGGGELIVDAKVTFNDFIDSASAADDAARAQCLARHAANMRAHVQSLSGKAYWEQFANAPEFVVMFVPGEHYLSAALEQDPDLWNDAFQRRVLLATPTNLVAIARTVAGVWRQEQMAKQAREIGELGKQLYARVAVMADHVARLGKNLGQSVDAYNKFIGSLDANVLTTARRFEDLKIETGGRAIDTPGVVEQSPRPSAKLPALEAGEAGEAGEAS